MLLASDYKNLEIYSIYGEAENRNLPLGDSNLFNIK